MSSPPTVPGPLRVLGFLALPLVSGASDPFQPGLRWIWPALATDPWIPCDVTFAAADNLAWVASAGSEGRWSALEVPGSSPAGPRLPRFEHAAPLAPAALVMAVAGERVGALFGLRQEPVAGLDKRSEVMRFDPVAAAGSAFAPEWTLTLGFVSPGPARVDTDLEGRLVVAGVLDPGATQVELSWIDGETGVLLARTTVPGAGLNELRVSDDGARVVVAAGLDVHVFGADGTPIDHLTRSAATPAVALSRTGRVLAVGASGQLDVFVERPAGYRRIRSLAGTPLELALRADLSAAGDRLAVAWWDRTTGVELRLETWDLARGTRLLEFGQAGAPGGLQNVPEALCISPDGARVALGTWGYGGPEPEVLLFDVDQPVPVFSADLPGSVQDLDLDSSGTRLVVAHKDAHANQFSSTGGVRFYDTGERELRLLGPPMLGQEMRLAARRAGAGNVHFLIGPRARRPVTLDGVGNLFLDPLAMRVFPRAADAQGRADWSFHLPQDPAWIGTPWSAQAAFRVGGATELSGDLLDPLILGP